MNRNCQKCIHHISGNCDAWGCEMQTLEDYRNKVIDEFAETLNNSIDMLDLNYEYRCDGGVQHQTLNNMREIIQELSEQMKAGEENE